MVFPASRPATGSPAASPRARWPWVAGALVAVAVGAGLYLNPFATTAALVPMETVAPGPLTRVLAVNGRIAARHSVAVSAGVAGTLSEVAVEEGDAVAAGEVLARIDAAGPQALLRQAVAGLDAGLVAQARARNARDRAAALGGNVTRNALPDAGLAVQAADEEVGRLTAVLDQAGIEVARYVVAAPMAGTVVARAAEPGQVVGATQSLLTLADLSTLVVEADIDEAYATQVAPGLAAVLRLVGEDSSRAGHVTSVAPGFDADTGARAIKIAFDASVSAPIGLTVTADIVFGEEPSAISVPRAALAAGAIGAGPSVFLAVEGVAVRRPVTVVPWPADRLVVTTGLAAGDVVIGKAAGLAEGDPVAPLGTGG